MHLCRNDAVVTQYQGLYARAPLPSYALLGCLVVCLTGDGRTEAQPLRKCVSRCRSDLDVCALL